MSKKATEFQRKAMSWMYRGKEIFKPLNTGWIDENVACVREWVANIFFYRKAFGFVGCGLRGVIIPLSVSRNSP